MAVELLDHEVEGTAILRVSGSIPMRQNVTCQKTLVFSNATVGTSDFAVVSHGNWLLTCLVKGAMKRHDKD